MTQLLKVYWLINNRETGDDTKTSQRQETLRFEFDGHKFDPNVDVLDSGRCPQEFSTHPVRNDLFVVGRNASVLTEAPQVCDVSLSYSNYIATDGSVSVSNSGVQKINNPLRRPATIKWDTWRRQKEVLFGYDDAGKATVPLVTTAGEPLEFFQEEACRVIRIEKNVKGMPLLLANGGDYINKDTVTIEGVRYEPLTLWATDIGMTEAIFEEGVIYRKMSFSLFVNDDTWETKLRNAGYLHRIPKRMPNGQWGSITDYIRMGNSNEFASTKMPLQNKPGVYDFTNPGQRDGQIFPEYLTYDPTTQQVIANPVTLSSARMREIWKEAQLEFITRRKINFRNLFPLS